MECLYFLFAKKYVRIPLSNIDYIKGNDSSVFVVTQKCTWELNLGLRQMEWMLPSNKFCRVHSFYIVQLEAVVGFDRNKIFLRDRELPLAAAFRKKFDCKLDALINEDINGEYVPMFCFSQN